MKKLIKELILVSGLTRLHLAAFVKRVLALVKAATDNPLIAPDLNPTPAEVKTKADAITTAEGEKTAMKLALIAKTKFINSLKGDMTNIINNSWAPQAQLAVNGDADKATKLGWHIKGVVT